MRYENVPVDRIRKDNKFDVYCQDPFGERERSVPVNAPLAQVILRETEGDDQYQLVFGQLIIEKLAPDAELPAAIYGLEELPDEECLRVILECDRTMDAQLLTPFERVRLIRQLRLNDVEAGELLGVSHAVVGKWRRGVELYEQITAVGHELPSGLKFYHLVKLAENAPKSPLPLDTTQKLGYLKKCADREMSVSKFEDFLKKQFDPEKRGGQRKKSRRKGKKKEGEGSPFHFGGGTTQSSDPREARIEEQLVKSGLVGVIQAQVEGDQLTFQVGPIPVSRLKEVAQCFAMIHVALIDRSAA